MKTLKFGIILLAAFALVAGFSGTGQAFHNGGVATCDSCHTMHNSSGNARMQRLTGNAGSNPVGTANAYLLQGTDQSSTCLMCHAGSSTSSYKVATYPTPAAGTATAQYTPGGDFAWLKKTFSWTAHGSAKTEAGDRHGHNVIAADFGYAADATLSAAPGGTYAAANLACSSCHDPHGKWRIKDDGSVATTGAPIADSGSYGAAVTTGEAVGVFRLLAGTGYVPKSYSGGPAFTADAPVAVAPSTYNAKETSTNVRVVYGAGMSEWCKNCHGGMHQSTFSSGDASRHPAGNGAVLPSAILTNYNTYVKSGDMTGAVATAYTSLVPFELQVTDRAALGLLTTSTEGATSTSNVACISCHRAHGSGFSSMTRWQNGTEFLTADAEWPGTDAVGTEAQAAAMGRTVAETKAAYYDRPATNYAAFQRSLCNKCHAKD